jgi:hypothetical protein
MIAKSLIGAALLLPLIALSSSVQAGQTITDKSYWPNETRTQPRYDVGRAGDWRGQAGVNQVLPSGTWVGSRSINCRYQGGPKSPMTCGR